MCFCWLYLVRRRLVRETLAEILHLRAIWTARLPLYPRPLGVQVHHIDRLLCHPLLDLLTADRRHNSRERCGWRGGGEGGEGRSTSKNRFTFLLIFIITIVFSMRSMYVRTYAEVMQLQIGLCFKFHLSATEKKKKRVNLESDVSSPGKFPAVHATFGYAGVLAAVRPKSTTPRTTLDNVNEHVTLLDAPLTQMCLLSRTSATLREPLLPRRRFACQRRTLTNSLHI